MPVDDCTHPYVLVSGNAALFETGGKSKCCAAIKRRAGVFRLVGGV